MSASDLPQQFVHLHNHSEHSLLDGYGHVGDMVQRAAQLGQPAMALTDHGNLYAAIDFYKAATAAGVKPIIGMEGYVAFGSRFDRSQQEGARGGSQPHLTMLAATDAGYRNLMELSTKAFLEGYYYRPRVDRELLAELNDGLIVLSGCLSGELARDILRQEGDLDAATDTAGQYREIFQDRYYLELMHHEHVPGQDKVNAAVRELSRRLDIPMVVTNDCHYVYPEDAKHQDTLMCILTQSKLAQTNRLRMEADSYYVKSAAEMHAMFGEVPEALANTLAIAEQCEISIGSGRVRLPKIEIPSGKTSEEYLRETCYAGAQRRFGDLTDDIRQRLDHELRIIEVTDFADYFLVVWDIFKFVKRAGILSTVRGSAASSLVLYCLDVIDFNPLDYGLFFERFLNVERREMPDIDMEFADDRRQEVIAYCLKKYGSERVAQIGTFGTMLTRSAIRDVARVMEDGVRDAEIAAACARLVRIANENAQLQPGQQPDDDDAGPMERNLAAIYDRSAEMQALCSGDPIAAEILDRAKGVEGRIRNVGTHAAGVVISDEPLVKRAPLQRPSKTSEVDVPATQFTMYPLEEVGLLKWDFLGLKNLSVLDHCLKLIAEDTGTQIDIYGLPLDDAPTFEMMGAGDTFGSFQIEGQGMTRYIKELKPTSVLDVASMIALYRPGPMQHIDQFINAKHGRTAVRYPHPSLANILEETYGVIVYQDQVMLVAQQFAGYTLGQADILRKAMGKKVPEIMQEAERNFVDGSVKQGHSESEARELFTYILPFAGYGFNKAHAVSYALITYFTTYFKANYPLHYWASMLDSFSDSPGRMSGAITSATSRGVRVLPPDINVSGASFTIDVAAREHDAMQVQTPAGSEHGSQGVIRYGLGAVKGVGSAVAQQICEARGELPFASVSEFCNRAASTGLTEATLRPLVQCGAFDSLASRRTMLEHLPTISAHMRSVGAARDSGQTILFGGDEDADAALGLGIDVGSPDDNRELTPGEVRSAEEELLGIAVTPDPAEEAQRAHIRSIEDSCVVFASSDKLQGDGSRVRCVGKIAEIRQRQTRNGDSFLIVWLKLLDESIECVVWPKVYEQTESIWRAGTYVDLRATVKAFDGAPNLEVRDAEVYLPLRQEYAEPADAPHHSGSGATAANGNGAAVPASQNGARNGHAPTKGAFNGMANGRADGADGNLMLEDDMPQVNGAHNGGRGPDEEPAVMLTFQNGVSPEEQRDLLHRVLIALDDHRGDAPVEARLDLGDRTVVMSMPFFTVEPSEELETKLQAILGDDNVLLLVE